MVRDELQLADHEQSAPKYRGNIVSYTSRAEAESLKSNPHTTKFLNNTLQQNFSHCMAYRQLGGIR
jgi:hypothetical protein